MNNRSFQSPLEQANSVSINIIHEEINNNSEELEKIKKLIDENKKNGYKIPLIATVLLFFHNAENNTLKKSDLYSLMEKETINNKNTIISSPTERYCIINQKNYKSKIKDIIKKKKWFTKKVNENKEIEFTLNPGVVSSIVPRITSFFKVLAKNDYLFINEKEEDKEEDKEETNKEQKAKKGKKAKKPKKTKQKDLEIEETEEKKVKKKESQIEDKKQETQSKKEKNENFIEYNNNINEKAMDKKESENKINEKENNSGKYTINIKKEEDIQEKEEKIEDFEIIIVDDDYENNNNISITKTEERISIQKIENNENNSDALTPKYLNKKRKPRKKKVNKNIKTKTEKEEISSSNNENSLSGENQDIINQIEFEAKHLYEKDSIKDEINNKDKTQNNKIDSIINFGEIFLQLLKSKKLTELASKKIDCIKEGIQKNEKEIKFYEKLIEKIKQKEKDINSVNIKEIENKIKEIQIVNEIYKEKNGKLSNDKYTSENTEIEDNKNNDINNFKENLEINEKMISDFSLIFNNFQNAGELLNMILIDEKRENNNDKNIMNNKNISIENKENAFKTEFRNSKTDIRLKKIDNYSDGNYIDLFKEENFSKINSNNVLDIAVVNKNTNL